MTPVDSRMYVASTPITYRFETEDTVLPNGLLHDGEDVDSDGVLDRRVLRVQEGVTAVLGASNEISFAEFELLPNEADGVNAMTRLRVTLAAGKELGSRETLLNWLVLLVVTTLFAVSYPLHHADDEAKLNELVPARATDFILASNLSGRMFNTYHYGGYLIFRLAPQQQVFIDIRGDMYGKAWMEDYRTAYQAKPGWQAILDRYAIDYIVCESTAPLLEAVTSSGLFAAVYRDTESAVVVRNDGRYQPLIAAYRER